MSKQLIKTRTDPRPIIQFTCDHCFDSDIIEAFDDTIYDIADAFNEFEERGWITIKVLGQSYDFCSDECYKNYTDRLL